MPIGKYYGGHGKSVMTAMRKQYGPERAERVFYATMRKRKKKLRRKGYTS